MIAWVIAILEVILRALLPAVLRASKKTAENSAAQPELRDRLHTRVRCTWGKALRRRSGQVLIVLLVILVLPGCGTRTIYVPSGEPVRLRETIKSAKVWVLDANGQPVAGVLDIPEGWYSLPMDRER